MRLVWHLQVLYMYVHVLVYNCLQLNELRSLLDGHSHAMQDNYRRTMPLNDRTVSRSFQSPAYTVVDGGAGDENDIYGDGNGATSATQPCTAVAILAATLMLVKLFT